MNIKKIQNYLFLNSENNKIHVLLDKSPFNEVDELVGHEDGP